LKLQGSKLIIRNTGILYAKTFITMGISLYSTRLILNALGSTDFGIFSLIGGIIAMLTFFNNAMTQATQRFLNYNLGSGNIEKLRQIFNASALLHLIIGILVVIIIELTGLWAFDYFLNIPIERLYAAKMVFHFIVISTFFTIISVPYDGIINAHEHMLFDSVLGIIQALGILTIALSIQHFANNKLIWYGAFMAALTIVLLIIRRVYCRIQYQESKLNFAKHLNKATLKEMIRYSKYTLMGAITSMFGAWGVTVLINKFFGPKLNATHGVAIQINGQILVFSNALVKAISPQITKSEGSGERKRMFELAQAGAKFSYILLAIFAIPFLLEAPFILKIWLKEPPVYASVFCQYALVVSLLGQLSLPIVNMVNAHGNIKALTFYSSIVFISILPLVFAFFYFGLPVFCFYFIQIINEIVLLIIRLFYAKKILNYTFSLFKTNVLQPVIIITIPTILLGLLIQSTINVGIMRLIIVTTITTITFVSVTYIWGLKENEKLILNKIFSKYLKTVKQ
jgi:O-antigen/teichoic acid export membrane protein